MTTEQEVLRNAEDSVVALASARERVRAARASLARAREAVSAAERLLRRAEAEVDRAEAINQATAAAAALLSEMEGGW
jgi:hypothetical protein